MNNPLPYKAGNCTCFVDHLTICSSFFYSMMLLQHAWSTVVIIIIVWELNVVTTLLSLTNIIVIKILILHHFSKLDVVIGCRRLHHNLFAGWFLFPEYHGDPLFPPLVKTHTVSLSIVVYLNHLVIESGLARFVPAALHTLQGPRIFFHLCVRRIQALELTWRHQ